MRVANDLAELARTFASIVERIAESGGAGQGAGGPWGPPVGCPPAGDGRDWIDQSKSPLGPRLHCRAVRRRMAEGKGGATIKARRHLLTREALLEEMEHSPKPGLRKTTGNLPLSPGDGAQRTLARLRLLRTR